MQNIKKIWALGDAVVDLLPVDKQLYQACAGGAPANVAISVAKLGQPAGFIGRVGKDAFGDFMAETFKENQVDCQSLQKDPEHKTSTVLVALDEKGERSFTFLVSPSADQFLTANAIPQFKVGDILHVCSLAFIGKDCFETVQSATQALKAQKGLISFDINLREQMWADKDLMRKRVTDYITQADILKLSEEELYWLTNTADWQLALEALSKHYLAPLTIITKGELGSVVLSHNKVFHFKAYQVNSIDTTGAGDAFIAGLLSYIALNGMLKNPAQIEAMITQASACGALATTKKGAIPALPNREFLEEFMQKNRSLKMQ